MAKLLNLVLIALLICIQIIFVACDGNSDNDSIELSKENARLIEEAWEIIHSDYVDTDALDSEALIDGALRGMVNAIGDPYSAYFSPEQNRELQEQLEGEYGGIGATLTMKDGMLTVVAPMPGSPAEEAGILSGDIIMEIDGQPTSELNLNEAALKIRGEKGTNVRLLVLHPDETDSVEIEIRRDDIELESVIWEMLPDDIAHLVITSFAENTEPELTDALKTIISEQGAKGIILDLRDNGGGLITAAVNVMDKFIEEGLVVYALDNQGKRTEWSVHHRGIAQEIPMAVLVNENSASASEIVAGAIQDHDRAPVIGAQTFGKGTAQVVQHLSNEGSVKITYSRWFTPNGQQIDGKGITPDIIVEIADTDIESGIDSQLEQAVSYLEGDM